MEPSVVCLGITDAGRCCFDKTTASLAGCCGGITSSYIFQKHRALGHLARKWKFRKKLVICRNRLVFMITDAFQRFAQPRQLSLFWSDLLWWCQGFWIFPYWFFSYPSFWFLQNVINCEREEGLSWSYRATVYIPLHPTGQSYSKRRSINAVLLCFLQTGA